MRRAERASFRLREDHTQGLPVDHGDERYHRNRQSTGASGPRPGFRARNHHRARTGDTAGKLQGASYLLEGPSSAARKLNITSSSNLSRATSAPNNDVPVCGRACPKIDAGRVDA